MVDAGAPSVNAEVKLNLPFERWVLVLRGPRLGPAVLYWSLLVIIGIAAFGLSRLSFLPLRGWQWLLLLIGLSQVPTPLALVVILWFLALAWRERVGATWSAWRFDFSQLVLVAWTVVAMVVLFAAIHVGLLETPQMHVEGNGSTSHALNWFQDRSDAVLPQARVISLPVLAYRLTMLAWALWLAASLVGWLQWAWKAFCTGGPWKALPKMPRRSPFKPRVAGAVPPSDGEEK